MMRSRTSCLNQEGKPSTVPQSVRSIVILAFDGITTSDVVGPIDVFHLAGSHSSTAGVRYDVVVASMTGAAVRSSSGIELATRALDQIDIDGIDTLIVPGGGPPDAPPIPEDVVAWLRQNKEKPRRICAVCTGIFLIAEAGMADRKRVTTHWRAADAFAARYPQVTLLPDPIFIKDGNLWSSAGFTAGLDVVLALIEEDLGHDIAMDVAQRLIMYLKRHGDQSQLSAPITVQSAGDEEFSKLHAWMVEHLGENIRIENLALRAGMSPRTFARRYIEKVGRTPGKTLDLFRIEAALRQMTDTDLTLKHIASQTGFGDEQNLRRTFMRHFGVLPRDYRGEGEPQERGRRAR
jgi:transcriptional regulator GlxA family with amidase domain